ncbi:DUF1488 family protein [Polynucleobacter sp. JS-Mosq-20-D10]|uniref:DUF1488 family protein n=1 Tax=Polynucleobacter sp. JS-Mosq-20-D10 TaxID=2576922 RepID=UPI001BFD448E|nr:DUF1488 family protein [Polynucleobacter sp. JS-Mosq-20-D10]QWE01116.1 DUF1488 family protein [Polynucleobacter sp. JS-Mosq-20-D10]
MKIEFIGPPVLAEDGGVFYAAKLDGETLLCHFSYEALEDVDPDTVQGDAATLFQKHQLKLLSIAEKKIRDGHAHDGQIQIFSNDLLL